MNKIYKQARKLRKKLKGKIEIPNIISYLENYGYSVVFFNTPEGDEILNSYGISVNDTNAFTYCGSVKIVFINGFLHTSDKLYSLLHEAGHILLGHIGNGNIEILNKRKTENEAEAFVYSVLNFKKYITTSAGLTALVLLIITLSFSALSIQRKKYDTAPVGSFTETVFITPTGAKYHRGSCIHIQGKNCTEVSVEQARRNYQPCLICNP